MGRIVLKLGCIFPPFWVLTSGILGLTVCQCLGLIDYGTYHIIVLRLLQFRLRKIKHVQCKDNVVDKNNNNCHLQGHAIMSAGYINNVEAICKFIQVVRNIPDWLRFIIFLLEFFALLCCVSVFRLIFNICLLQIGMY